MSKENDYLALITYMGGGSWARGKDKMETAKRCARIFKSDWKGLVKLKRGAKLKVNIYDCAGHDTVSWDDLGFYDKDRKPIVLPHEVVEIAA